MSHRIEPKNLMAQLHYRAIGNPVSTLPSSAISNCFPGLEYDFKNFWRRAFVGIVLLEWDNYVTDSEGDQYEDLIHHRLLKVEDQPLVTLIRGPQMPGGPDVVLPLGSAGVVTMEWSNALAFLRDRHGQEVTCHFTASRSDDSVFIPEDPADMIQRKMIVRRVFDASSLTPTSDFLRPGELTQGLCSPWQHDYRECSCYYWPASRPDYVNIEPTPNGVSHGDNWLSKARPRTGEYVPDDRRDPRLVSYDELFQNWERELRFQIEGRDAEGS